MPAQGRPTCRVWLLRAADAPLHGVKVAAARREQLEDAGVLLGRAQLHEKGLDEGGVVVGVERRRVARRERAHLARREPPLEGHRLERRRRELGLHQMCAGVKRF